LAAWILRVFAQVAELARALDFLRQILRELTLETGEFPFQNA
jgi:hypothetical protein